MGHPCDWLRSLKRSSLKEEQRNKCLHGPYSGSKIGIVRITKVLEMLEILVEFIELLGMQHDD